MRIPRAIPVRSGSGEMLKNRLAQQGPIAVPIKLAGLSRTQVCSKTGSRDAAKCNHADLMQGGGNSRTNSRPIEKTVLFE